MAIRRMSVALKIEIGRDAIGPDVVVHASRVDCLVPHEAAVPLFSSCFEFARGPRPLACRPRRADFEIRAVPSDRGAVGYLLLGAAGTIALRDDQSALVCLGQPLECLPGNLGPVLRTRT